MLLSKALAQSTERGMKVLLVDKNLPLSYSLKMKIGKKGIFKKVILAFGKEQV